MRIGELSARTGVPVPTIKYYVREGLLSGGERLSHNQVSYGEEHARRLRLVRALVEIGSLPIATVREVLAEVDRPGRDLDSTLGFVTMALATSRGRTEPDEASRSEAAAIAARSGWTGVRPDHPYLTSLAEVIAALRNLGLDDLIDRVDHYAAAAQAVAESDIELLADRKERDEVIEAMIVGTVLGDALLATMRRIAHVQLSGQHFKGSGKGSGKQSDTRQAPEPPE